VTIGHYILIQKGLAAIVALLSILLIASQVDDKLSAEAIRLITPIEATGSSDAYLYLTGIYADENEQPQDVGQAMLNQFQLAQADESYLMVDYPQVKKLPLPQGELFCKTWQDGCLKTIFNTDVDLTKLYQQHATLAARAVIFHRFTEYTTLTKPTISEQYPPYQYLAMASRLEVLKAISQHRAGNTQQAVTDLLLHLKTLRNSLALQDNLIGKIFLLMKISEVIDVTSIILSKTVLKTKINIDVIAGLSAAEKDFRMIAAREFAMSYYMFKQLDKNPELFHTGGNVPGWIIRMIYKPNMTINAIVPNFSEIERLAQLTPAAFTSDFEQSMEIYPSTSRVRNYVGNTLIAVYPDFVQYVARFMDLAAKLVLFNQRYVYKDDLKNAKNPYYADQRPDILSDRVCFSGPLEDSSQLRCLRIKI